MKARRKAAKKKPVLKRKSGRPKGSPARGFIPREDVTLTGRGRPTGLTPELIDEVCATIENMNRLEVAIARAGISKATFSYWMKRAHDPKERDPIYQEFSNRIYRSEAIAEAKYVDRNEKASEEGNLQATHFALTHGHSRKHWRKHSSLEISGEGGSPLAATTIVIGGDGRDLGEDMDRILEERRRRKLGHGDKKQIEYVGSQELPGEEDG